jgi:GT2 family glycosyltransferase
MSAPPRPTVSLVVPFAGSDAELAALAESLRAIVTHPSDELIVADNRPDATDRSQGRVQIRAAAGASTPGFARNRGAQTASGEWLLFIDADTRPAPGLLDAYFATEPAPGTGLLAGAITDVAERPTLAARYTVARHHMSQQLTLTRPQWPYAQTANCAVRRRAFEQVGGFVEDAWAAEDADLCFRLQDRGWCFEERPDAAVEHRSREQLGSLLAQLARHGSGTAWCNRRHPGSFPPPAAGQLLARAAHSARAAGGALVRGRGEEAAFAIIDLLGIGAFEVGRMLPNTGLRRGRTG